jgi:hypothetical protein
LSIPDWLPLIGKVDAVLAALRARATPNLNNHSRRNRPPQTTCNFAVPPVAIALDADIVVIENVPAVVYDRSQVVKTTERLLRDNGIHGRERSSVGGEDGWPQRRLALFFHDRPTIREAV